RLTEEQARHRQVTAKLYRRGGRVERMELINGYGSLAADNESESYVSGRDDLDEAVKECRWDYTYNSAGRTLSEKAYDQNGRLVWALLYSGEDLNAAHYEDALGYVRSRSGSGAAYVEFVRSPDGRDVEIRFKDRNGDPQPDKDGVFALRYEYDAR